MRVMIYGAVYGDIIGSYYENHCAVSLGGDADTMACIAGGIAEAFYQEIPKNIRDFCNIRLDGTIKKVINDFRASHGEV